MKGTLVIVAALLVAGVVTQECNKNSCSECIRIPNCMWCAKPGNLTDDEGNNLSRCKRIQSEFSDVWREACTEEFINQPFNYYELVKDEELTKESVFVESEAGYEKASVVQIRPQQVKLNLRVQEDLELETFYKQALDYPVDLYYLMDLSKSMEDDKKSLSQLGQQLADEMQNITKNFRLGFGSFVDKVVMPYVSTVPSKLQEPCSGCRAPYGFKNALPLNTNASRFTEEVREAQVSGNLDAPEGGFDAIMQAIVCQEDINWRQNARRLLVFSTDAGFHYAGDGKLGGIVKPNDGLCHLDKGEYTHSHLQDYPSVSQINQVAKTHKINLIFAVTAELTSVYSRLAKMVEGSYHGELTSDSSNVVQLVKDQYEAITSKVELKDNATHPLSITYYSKCLGNEEKETSVCEGLRVGDTVNFRLKFHLKECPADERDWIQKIGIYPVGIQETLIIDLKMLCSCNCESPGDPGYIAEAKECDFHGTYKCGVCDCDDGYFGRKCECGAETPWGTAGNIDNSGCFETPNSTMCTGRGTCYCGECDCNKRDSPEEEITGDFCECTNFQCSRQHGQLCSGPDHGRCVCNKCICEQGWKGDDCSCEDSTDQCYNPDDPTKECSGNGKCKCNKCDCFELEEGRFSGKWCEDCPTCKGKCQEYKACVQCLVFQTGELEAEDCLKNCTFFNVTEVPIAKVEQEGDKLCTFYDENDCRFTFVYGYEDGEPVVRVQQTLECPPKLDILGIVLGVIGAIVAVGLALLLMWKVLTTIHDQREFARFEKERMMAKWDTGENPIYRQATSTFKNPIYGGK